MGAGKSRQYRGRRSEGVRAVKHPNTAIDARTAAIECSPRPAQGEENRMAVQLFRVILPVSDIEEASRFYGTVLGTHGLRVSNGRHYFDCGGTILACFSPRQDGDGWDARPNPDHFYFAVDDLEAAYRACQKVNAEFSADDVHGDPAGRIARRPWGERSFYIKDPFGNPICFVDAKTTFRGS